jgi:hypothetical protein
MAIHLPKPTVPVEERKLSLNQVGARWRTPTAIVRFELEKAGVPFVDVEQKPRKGVRLADLLAYEAKLRSEMARPRNRESERAPTLEVVR